MTTLLNIPRLNDFVQAFGTLLDSAPDEARVVAEGGALLQALVENDDWLPASHAQPDAARYSQYLLHADARERFSVVSFVWGPGQATPIHNHTVWGLIGMLRGAEVSQPYALSADGQWQADGSAITLHPGDVEAVSPSLGDVHRVHNALAEQTSISIHVYGADIGKVKREVYFPDGSSKLFISGYSQPVSTADIL
jgi:predicted metal-dependent enzyme (double-stranded beta helix superfamily)